MIEGKIPNVVSLVAHFIDNFKIILDQIEIHRRLLRFDSNKEKDETSRSLHLATSTDESRRLVGTEDSHVTPPLLFTFEILVKAKRSDEETNSLWSFGGE